MVTDSVQKLIDNRKKTHGDWDEYSEVSQNLKILCKPGNFRRTSAQNEALSMICGKLARIITGDADCADHWDDVAGYALLGKNGHNRRETARAVSAQTVCEAYEKKKKINRG